MAQGSTQQSQVDGNQSHVTKVKACLQESMHLGLEHKVVNPVYEYISRSRGSGSKRRPLPQIVLCVQAKVNHDN